MPTRYNEETGKWENLPSRTKPKGVYPKKKPPPMGKPAENTIGEAHPHTGKTNPVGEVPRWWRPLREKKPENEQEPPQ